MKDFPKIELHCHLDGSVRPHTIFELGNELGIQLPTNNEEELLQYLVAPMECDSLDTYLTKFDLPISVMQSEEALVRCSYELVEDNALENVKYLEMRFNPLAHTNKGLSVTQVIASVLKGMKQGEEDFDIKTNCIIAFNRLNAVDELYTLIAHGKEFIGRGLVAIDLCGAESESFVRKYIKPLKVARKAGFKVTIHAGETSYPKNVVEACEYLDTNRIGHGVAIIHHEPSLEYVIGSKVLLEVCPSSNIQTKAFQSYSDHPIDKLMKLGAKLSVGTDNRTVSNISLTDEYQLLAKTFNWDQGEFAKVYHMSVEASFAKAKTKEWLTNIGNSYYK